MGASARLERKAYAATDGDRDSPPGGRGVTQDELKQVVSALSGQNEVSLDELADALGGREASFDDVDTLMRALEAQGTRITGPEGGGGEQRLFTVIRAARELATELGRRPSVDEISTRAAMPRELVWRALLLARVMG